MVRGLGKIYASASFGRCFWSFRVKFPADDSDSILLSFRLQKLLCIQSRRLLPIALRVEPHADWRGSVPLAWNGLSLELNREKYRSCVRETRLVVNAGY